MVSYQHLQGKPNEAHSKASAMCNWEVFGIYAGKESFLQGSYDSIIQKFLKLFG
jgi:hypothetical protein